MRKKYGLLLILSIVFLIALTIFIRGGITGNPIYKVYGIEDFPGIYIDFGPSQNVGSYKWGAAAVGNVGEFWNAPFVNNSQYIYFPLKYSNGEKSEMKLQLSNFDRNGEQKTNLMDEMFDSYIYTSDVNKVPSILISDFIQGEYDLYLYGNQQDFNANYEVYGYNFDEGETKYTFFGLRSSFINSGVMEEEVWKEGVHFVVYKDIALKNGDSLEILIKSFGRDGEISNAFISGMQIVKAGTNKEYNQSDDKISECFDSDGGIVQNVSGKVYVNGRYSTQDMCDYQNTYLNEIYCEEGIKSIEMIKCENGCVDGICITDTEFLECDGCLYNQICKPKGSRIDNKYCDTDKFLKLQEDWGSECLNNFECTTNSCFEGKCESLEQVAQKKLGIKFDMIKLLCRIGHLSDGDFQDCMYEAFKDLIDENRVGEIKVENAENTNSIGNENNESIDLPEPSL